MLGQYFFWAGLAAVAAFFACAALLGLAFFTPQEAARRRLAIAQSAVTALLLAFTAASAWLLRGRLAPWAQDPPPSEATAELAAMRETMSLMLLGLSCTVAALLTAFAWIRNGRAGAALRALVWAVPAVRLVIGCAAVLDYFGAPRGTPETPDAGAVAAWIGLAAAAERQIFIACCVAAGLALLTWPVGRWMKRTAPAA